MLTGLGAPLAQGDAQAPHCAAEGDILPFGDELIRVLATPGHTTACLSFAWRDRPFYGGPLVGDACPYQL